MLANFRRKFTERGEISDIHSPQESGTATPSDISARGSWLVGRPASEGAVSNP